MWSIQFPNGLRLIVHPTTIVGDIQDINTLNHYIGMAPVSDDLFPELRVLPALFLTAAALCALCVVVRAKWLTLAPLFILAGTALYGVRAMLTRLYQYGHDLDPEAAITLDPFTPPMFGEFRIAQFATYSYFGSGTTLAVVAGSLVALAVIIERANWER
jgi:hypothetical protein